MASCFLIRQTLLGWCWGLDNRGWEGKWAEAVVLTNFGGFLDVHPLAIILQQELVAAWGILQGNAVDGPRAKYSHSCCCLHTSQHITAHRSTAQRSAHLSSTLYYRLRYTLHDTPEHRVQYQRQSESCFVVMVQWRWQQRGRGLNTWSRPVTPTSLSPGQTPKIVPTVKLVSTMEEPSKGSKATLKPSPAEMKVILSANLTARNL